jgi:hypothetical protein
MGLLDDAVLDDQGISLAARATKNGSAIKGKIKRIGEL